MGAQLLRALLDCRFLDHVAGAQEGKLRLSLQPFVL